MKSIFFLLILAACVLVSCGTTADDEGATDMRETSPITTQLPTLEDVSIDTPSLVPEDAFDDIPSPNLENPRAPIPVAEMGDKPAWEDVGSFACHYGLFTQTLGLFDVVILEPRNISAAQLEWLRERGTFTIGYISVGEDTMLRELDGQGPGGYASFYIDDGMSNPARNHNWNSYFVDAGHGLWQHIIIERARELLNMGFDGIFLDTIDTAEIFPETQAGMAALIRRLRSTFPDAKIIANRGFFMMDDFAAYISGIMFEAFTGGYNFARREYTVHTGYDLAWTSAIANEINRIREEFYFPIFVLDYAEPNDIDTIQMMYDRAWKYDFLPSVSVIMLNQVFWRDIQPQTQRGIHSGLSRWQ